MNSVVGIMRNMGPDSTRDQNSAAFTGRDYETHSGHLDGDFFYLVLFGGRNGTGCGFNGALTETDDETFTSLKRLELLKT